MPVVLHKIDGSPPCRAVFMTLEVINLKVDYIEVNTLAGDTLKPEFLEKNPLHTVPLIEEGDFILADSHAIMTYLVSKYGAEKKSDWYPADLRTRALIDQKLHFDNGTLFPRLLAVLKSIFFTKSPPTEEQLANFDEAYGIVEAYLKKSPYLVGDHPTLADISCVATISTMNLLRPINAEKYSKLMDWFNRIQETSWYQKGNVKGLTEIAKAFKGGK